MSEPPPLDPTYPLAGRDLRHAALVVLDRRGAASIGEIIEVLAHKGFRIWGSNPRKVLSDALRHEVWRGRARRVGWGRYAIEQLARTTRWRIGTRWDGARPLPNGPEDHDVPRACAGNAIPWSVHDRRYPYDFIGNGRWRSVTGRKAMARFMNMQRQRRLFREHMAHKDAGLPPPASVFKRPYVDWA